MHRQPPPKWNGLARSYLRGIVALLLLSDVLRVAPEATNGNKDNKDGNDDDPIQQCGLFMAESSIPGAGWGMYSGIDRHKGDPILPFDIAIQMVDMHKFDKLHTGKMERPAVIPKNKLREYYWTPEVAFGTYEAGEVESVIPGLGMLANCHPALINVENFGPSERKYDYKLSDTETRGYNNGAHTHLTEQTFKAKREIEAGHELFIDYGESWFTSREWLVGYDFPLKAHYKIMDKVTKSFSKVSKHGDLPAAEQLWNLTSSILNTIASPRAKRTIPETTEDALSASETSTAYLNIPNAIRSLDWLREHGLCMDHVESKPSSIPSAGIGAFAKRRLPKGTIVSPLPMVPVSRFHLDMYIMEPHENTILWEGHQLLLNYAYGHPDSTLLLFPYATGANLVNHATHGIKEPNVELRVPANANKEDHSRSAAYLLTGKSSIIFELVAIKDIEEGEEILLDYGDVWQQAWDDHGQEMIEHDVPSHNYTSAFTLNEQRPFKIKNDRDYRPYPKNVQMRCFVPKARRSGEKRPKRDHNKPYSTIPWDGEVRKWNIDQSYECELFKRDIRRDSEGSTYWYTIRANDGDNEWYVHSVADEAVFFVDKPYTAPQFQRNAFRKEIQIPDAVFPTAWRDVKEATDKCGLYMAESSIPNSGLGMFTTREIPKGVKIFSGDVVVNVEDIAENVQLSKWKHNDVDIPSPPGDHWLLDSYYWNAGHARSSYEADDVQSIVPGLGMLANSHTGLVNAHMIAPKALKMLNTKDAGIGASTHYHDVHYVASETIEAGSEIFDEYGDQWFEDREATLGVIPLSDDFKSADSILKKFIAVAGFEDVWSSDLWSTAMTLLLDWDANPRLNMALPQTYEQVEEYSRLGCAKCSVENRVRSAQWLEANGRCIDNIRPGKSKIDQASMGAFATRDIGNKAVIAPAPLIHLHRRHMEVLLSEDVDDSDANIEHLRYQQLMNYCYGHPESDILFFPYSPVFNYINHNAKNPNARLRWSTMPNHKKEWLRRTADAILQEPYAGLIMELVATRNISKGEEVVIDYGPSWESAWKKHVENWEPKDADVAEPVFVAPELNDMLDWISLPQSDHDDTQTDRMENVFSSCYVQPLERKPHSKVSNGTYANVYTWKYGNGLFNRLYDIFDCEVVEREIPFEAHLRKDTISPLNVTYTVRVYPDTDRTGKEYWLVKRVPRRAIEFFDQTYSSDLFHDGAFRHEIHLPDDMMPSEWRK